MSDETPPSHEYMEAHENQQSNYQIDDGNIESGRRSSAGENIFASDR